MSVREASVAVTIASLLFLVAARQLNLLCLILAPLALAWVFFYSYTKRFMRWSHLVLGVGLSIAPVGGYLAITGHWSNPWWMLIALAIAVATWVGGFDILYALQDVSFDAGERSPLGAGHVWGGECAGNRTRASSDDGGSARTRRSWRRRGHSLFRPGFSWPVCCSSTSILW